MLQPNKNQRKSVASSDYDAQFEQLQNITFPDIDVTPTYFEGATGSITKDEREEYEQRGINFI
ncbi:MAG TPA: hypothetical protein DCX01_04430, partial [Bacteroidetes bacterium]|nr:hypothetical protein [Bacteroidota bacterium]